MKRIVHCRCKREMFVLDGTDILVCVDCDFAAEQQGPVRPLRDQAAR